MNTGSHPVGPLISCTPVDAIPAAPLMYVSQALQDWSMGGSHELKGEGFEFWQQVASQ